MRAGGSGRRLGRPSPSASAARVSTKRRSTSGQVPALRGAAGGGGWAARAGAQAGQYSWLCCPTGKHAEVLLACSLDPGPVENIASSAPEQHRPALLLGGGLILFAQVIQNELRQDRLSKGATQWERRGWRGLGGGIRAFLLPDSAPQ